MRTYTIPSRFLCLLTKFFESSLIGMAGGLVGQSMATGAMQLRRAANPGGTYTVEPPPILASSLVWGLFMGASSNLRYQAVFGIERLVDGTIAKRVPQVRHSQPTALPCVSI